MNIAKGTMLDKIEGLTRDFGAARTVLAERMGALEAELLAVKQRHLRGIRTALSKAQDVRDALAAEIEAHPELFEKPRTVTVDGIKVGLAKGKGKIVWDDEATVVALIDKHFPESGDMLVKTTRTPIRAALASLTVAELQRIGCRVEESSDEVVIKPQDSELDKLVDRLLQDSKELREVA